MTAHVLQVFYFQIKGQLCLYFFSMSAQICTSLKCSSLLWNRPELAVSKIFMDVCKSQLCHHNNSDNLLSSYYALGIEVLQMYWHLLSYSILSHSLRSYYYPNFIDRKTKVLEDLVTGQFYSYWVAISGFKTQKSDFRDLKFDHDGRYSLCMTTLMSQLTLTI